VTEVYVSVDIESDGPCPGLNSMLQLGAVAFDEWGKELDSFQRNLELLPEATQNASTMEWWSGRQNVYDATRVDTVSPQMAMKAMDSWLLTLGARPVFVAYPAGFDFTFVYWYMHKFIGGCRFGFQALDLKSYASAVLSRGFKNTVKSKMPAHWFEGLPEHNHVAVDDAREQGMLYFRMREARRGL